MDANLVTLLIVSVIAVAAPLVAEVPVGVHLPIVVVEIVFGIVVGPHLLGWGSAEGVLGQSRDLQVARDLGAPP